MFVGHFLLAARVPNVSSIPCCFPSRIGTSRELRETQERVSGNPNPLQWSDECQPFDATEWEPGRWQTRIFRSTIISFWRMRVGSSAATVQGLTRAVPIGFLADAYNEAVLLRKLPITGFPGVDLPPF